MLLVLDARREEERGLGAGGPAVAERQRPEPLDGDGVALGVGELAEEGAGAWVEGVDAPVAEVADQQGVAERAEPGRRRGQTPGGVQRALRGESAQENPAGVEDIDEAVSVTKRKTAGAEAPSLPAETTTITPAAVALRRAFSKVLPSGVSPPSEKLTTLAPCATT